MKQILYAYLTSKKVLLSLLNIILFITFILLLKKFYYEYLIYLKILLSLIKPLFYALIITYIIHPYMQKHEKVPMFLKIILYLFIIFITLFFMFKHLLPSLIQSIEEVMIYIKEMIALYDLKIPDTIMNINTINTSVNIINKTSSLLSSLLFTFALTIYFLLDYEMIKKQILKAFYFIHSKSIDYLYYINIELRNYINAFILLMVIQSLCYGIIFYIISHKHFIILGLLSGISSIIPYFGPIIITVLGLLTILPISKKAFILGCILSIIYSNIDSYFITPKIYKSKVKIHPISALICMLVCNKLFSFTSLIFCIPVLIIIKTILYVRKTETKFPLQDATDNNKQ